MLEHPILRQAWLALRDADPTLLAMAGVTFLVLLVALLPRRARAPPDYSSADFWEQRYHTHPEPFEWYIRHADLAAAGFLTPQMLRIDGLALLDVGCGNSGLAEDMHRAGAGSGVGGKGVRIVGIDFSAAAVEAAQDAEAAARSWSIEEEEEEEEDAGGSGGGGGKKRRKRVSKYRVLDARDMRGAFADGSFDMATDKGTLDGIVGATDKCCPARRDDARRVVAEVARVLGRGATYVTVSVTDWSLPKWRTWLGLEQHFAHFNGARIGAQQGGKTIAVFVNAWTRLGGGSAADGGRGNDGDEQKKTD